MCKFWYQLGNEIHFEIKFQKVNNNILEYENVEKGILIQSSRSNIDMIELMTFKIYFNSDEAKKYEKGLSQKISDDKINVLIEKWITDYENDIYEKEKYPRKINELKQDIQGEREGKNLHGQYWNERWYGSWDKKYQGWKKQTFEENESVRLELGESHDQTSEVSIRNEQWQEKLEKQNDYWENSWEQIISYDQNLQNCDLVREGKKSFKNNRSYIYQEEWKEYKSGEIKVVKFKDDGFGQKNHEYYSLFKKDDIIEYELKQGSIEDVSKNVKVEISQGKTFKGLYDEWNNERIVDFNQGFEKVSNTGKNHLGEWKETWGEQNNVKWAYKEGTNFFTSEQWKEEWYEKRSSQNEIEEHKVEKWGRNNQEEWNEKWGEVYNGDKKEKWADKWTVDIQSGYKRGVNWGHQLDEELKPKHHWVEQWDNNGTIVKRQENY
ncbi:UNKNOWN [Stylonychia lemnae]|uniref:Uncharacterized protein n=1 Tax=Stylonychia lemnae TaxID=5949 RepID=A0A078AX24_STYLE|nr:UNKNOWN [Stylonychia lemnae]|eukprot:CDW85343.1 UNKNOWN [Stylonychia lemnae]